MKKETKEAGKGSFFHYHQNNSGGEFCGPAIHVIVEADSADDANNRAESHGLYFDGYGDCECCGTRWSSQWNGDKGDVTPCIYETPVDQYEVKQKETGHFFDWSTKKIPLAIVYYKDGREETFRTEGK